MRPSDIISSIRNAFYPIRQPVVLWGSPGVGKSDIVRQAASTIGGMVDVRGSLLDPVDLRGVPSVDKEAKICHWNPPAFLPRSGSGILFLDEISQCHASVQSAMLQLALDRQIGEYRLPDGWSVVAAGNRSEDRAGVQKLVSPLLNRFVHIDLTVSLEDWLSWAVENAIVPEVIAFMRWNEGALLNTFDKAKDTGEKAIATPRTWSFVSKLFPHTPEQLRPHMFGGAIGVGPASEFSGYLKYFAQLPDLDNIIANPLKAPVPDGEAAVMYALCASLPEKLRTISNNILSEKDTTKKADLEKKREVAAKAILAYAGRFEAREFNVMLCRDCIAVWSGMMNLNEFKQWIKDNRDVMVTPEDIFGKKKGAA